MKNNKLTNILLIVLMILSIGLITYIFIDKDDKTNDDKNDEIKEQENNTVTNSVSKALNIYDTIKDVNLLSLDKKIDFYKSEKYSFDDMTSNEKVKFAYRFIELNDIYKIDENKFIEQECMNHDFENFKQCVYKSVTKENFEMIYKDIFKENIPEKIEKVFVKADTYCYLNDDFDCYKLTGIGGPVFGEDYINKLNKIEETDKYVYIYENSLVAITDNMGIDATLQLASNSIDFKNNKLISDLSKINEYNENKIEKEELLEYYKNDLSTFKHTFKKENGNVYYEKTELVK